jgi:hypothetical protein
MRAVGLFTRKREPASSLNTIKRAKLLGRRKYVVKTLFTPHNSNSSGPQLKSGNSGNPQLLPPAAVAMPLNDSKSRLVLVVPPGAEVGAVTKLSRHVPGSAGFVIYWRPLIRILAILIFLRRNFRKCKVLILKSKRIDDLLHIWQQKKFPMATKMAR